LSTSTCSASLLQQSNRHTLREDFCSTDNRASPPLKPFRQTIPQTDFILRRNGIDPVGQDVFHRRSGFDETQHQINVLQRSPRGRIRHRARDQFFWVWLSRLWSGGRSALAIVKPETVISWYRKGFRGDGCA